MDNIKMDNITRKQLVKKLNEASEKNYTIDLILDDEELINLEPLIIEFDLMLKCTKTTIYLSRIKGIRVYKQKENSLRCELIYIAEVTQSIEKMTKKELEHELRFLREVVKHQEIEISKLIQGEKYTKNARGAGRKPYDNFEVVKRIFDYYINGYSTNKIADILNNESGLINNKPWSKSSIRVILLNTYYLDKCIDIDTFYKVKEIMKNKPKGRGKKESN